MAAPFPVVFLPWCGTVLRKHQSYVKALPGESFCPVFAGILAVVILGTKGPTFVGSEM